MTNSLLKESRKSVFIAGGTTGLGYALAQEYLLLGYRVGVGGRSVKKVTATAEPKSLLFYCHFYCIDVSDRSSVENAMEDFASGGLDIVLAVAGSYASRKDQILSISEINEMIQTNLQGTLNVFSVATHLFLKMGRKGHLAALSSMTAIQNYPKATVYAGTKKAILEVCSIFRDGYGPYGISVTEVIPGYIATEKLLELNRKFPAPRPFLMSPKKAAKKIVQAIQDRQDRVIFPWQTYIIAKLISCFPFWIQHKILNFRGLQSVDNAIPNRPKEEQHTQRLNTYESPLSQ